MKIEKAIEILESAWVDTEDVEDAMDLHGALREGIEALEKLEVEE